MAFTYLNLHVGMHVIVKLQS